MPVQPNLRVREYEIVTLKEHIDDIGNRLNNKEFPNEQAVRQGIIDRLLINLGWPTYDTQVVYPEYTVGTGKVDYALCDPQSKNPRVFIEAKQVGNIEGAEEQLFGYDFRIRVPIAVLTDGQKWRFFHPPGEGTWMERKVQELDLVTTDSGESAHWLERYLSYEAIRTGEADRSIKEDYENLVNQRQVERHLPDAWKNLVQSGDELLVELVAEATRELCGHSPTNEQVLAFLKREGLPPVQPSRPEPSIDQPEQPDTSKSRKRRRSTRLRVTMSNGEVIEHLHAKATFIEMIERFGLEKVMSVHPSTVLTEPPKYFWDSHGQFYIHHYASTKRKKRVLEEIAQLVGVQLTIEIVEK